MIDLISVRRCGFFFVNALLFSMGASAQPGRMDSLLHQLRIVKQDTQKANICNVVSWDYIVAGDFGRGASYAKKALSIAERVRFKAGIANAYHNLGVMHYYQSNYPPALKNFFKSLEVRASIPDTNGMSGSHNNIGNIYMNLSQYDKSLYHYFESLKLREAIGNKKAMAKSYNNIGNIYSYKAEYEKALEYYRKGLAISESLHEEVNIASSYMNIGIIYSHQSNYPKSLEYYFKALKLYEKLNDPYGITSSYNNIGNLYKEQHDFKNALKYFQACLELDIKHDNKEGISGSYNAIGDIFAQRGDLKKAHEYFSKSLEILRPLGDDHDFAAVYINLGLLFTQLMDDPEQMKSVLSSGSGDSRKFHLVNELALLDSAFSLHSHAYRISKRVDDIQNMSGSLKGMGDLLKRKKEYSKAIRFYNEAISLSRDIGARNTEKEIAHALYQCYSATGESANALKWLEHSVQLKDSIFNKENARALGKHEARFELEKQQALKEAERKKDQEKKDALHKAELDKQTQQRNALFAGLGLVLALAGVSFAGYRNKRRANQELSLQKAIIEEKNKDILDSIVYAERIQRALLKEEEHVSSHLPEHFIFFRPKDIVSGDFYWSHEKNGYWYLAAVDCTGHGVPGAFMSMLGVSFLNEITASEKLPAPDQVLNLLKSKIVKELGESSNDGMDISLLRLHLESGRLDWAGANNPLWVFSRNGFSQFRPDKQPIGNSLVSGPFTLHSTTLTKGDTVYFFTDGYADQFGGEKGKKFKTSKLKDLLQSIQHEPLKKQKLILSETFDAWKGNLEQVDDVCVIGVRV